MGGWPSGGEEYPPWNDSEAPADYPWFRNLWDSITERLQNVKDSIIGGLVGPFQWIADGLNAIAEGFGRFIQYFNPWSEYFFLKVALVPKAGYFQEFWGEIYNKFNEKLPFITQILEFFEPLKSVVVGSSIPKFEVTLPQKYGGGTFSIVDFSYFDLVRDVILNFIRYSAWFFFLKKLYTKLPRTIY